MQDGLVCVFIYLRHKHAIERDTMTFCENVVDFKLIENERPTFGRNMNFKDPTSDFMFRNLAWLHTSLKISDRSDSC
jgi:hypothetical protein